MKKLLIYILFFSLNIFTCVPVAAQTDILHLKSNATDTIFGKTVPDPYRWLEDLNSDSVKQWLKAQKKITEGVRQKFKGRLLTAYQNLYDHSGYRLPATIKTGPWYFGYKSSGTTRKPSAILYYYKNLDDNGEVAFDPNDYNDNKTIYTIAGWELSDSNRYLVVAMSPGGSDWREIRVHDMAKGKDLKDKISWVKFSDIVWWKDGFFYARYQKPEDGLEHIASLPGQELYYHKLGDSQESDKLIMALSDSADDVIGFQKTKNGRYFVVNKPEKINGEWYNVNTWLDLHQGLSGKWNLLSTSPKKDEVSFDVIDAIDSSFIVISNYKAPHHRLLRFSMDTVNQFTELIPEKSRLLMNVKHIHHELVAIYFYKGRYFADRFDYKGKLIAGIKFDEGVSVSGFYGEPDSSEMIFYENKFYMPPVAFRYNFNTREIKLVKKTQVDIDASNYITKLVTYLSKDSTEVPMYITYKKGMKLSGDNPVILYGYGGFGISMTPSYSYRNILWFENNGILAVPLIRGGGEMGSEWHNGGKRLHKQNSFDDFIAAAEYLIKEGYTNKEKLAIMGGSNGGLLVGALLTQRPDLFKVAVAQVGAFDMVRFNKFSGDRYWIDEYGSPDDSVQFNNLFGYSPLHHVKAGVAYPAALFLTASNDDRVPPFHTFKFLAALQELSGGDNPHILFFQEDAGHHGSSDYEDRKWEEAFELAFICTQMKIPLNMF